jgi:hypothetical protein
MLLGSSRTYTADSERGQASKLLLEDIAMLINRQAIKMAFGGNSVLARHRYPVRLHRGH